MFINLTKSFVSPADLFKSSHLQLTIPLRRNNVTGLCNVAYDVTRYELRGLFCDLSACVFCVLMFQLNSPMNSVSSTEDIKPPLGLNGVMKVPAQPSGTALSLTKHICAICGDRSSGEWHPIVVFTKICKNCCHKE